MARRGDAPGVSTAGRTSSPPPTSRFDVHPTHAHAGDFHGAVTRRPIGELMLVDCAASPFLGIAARP